MPSAQEAFDAVVERWSGMIKRAGYIKTLDTLGLLPSIDYEIYKLKEIVNNIKLQSIMQAAYEYANKIIEPQLKRLNEIKEHNDTIYQRYR